jgi:hypothetical protein
MMRAVGFGLCEAPLLHKVWSLVFTVARNPQKEAQETSGEKGRGVFDIYLKTRTSFLPVYLNALKLRKTDTEQDGVEVLFARHIVADPCFCAFVKANHSIARQHPNQAVKSAAN